MSAPVMRSLEVVNPAASAAFYRDVLGFAVRSAPDEAQPELGLGPATIRLVPPTPGSAVTPQVVFFQVENLAGLHASVSARGAAPSAPARVNWIKHEVFELRDPDGHTLWFGESFDRPHSPVAEPMLQQALPVLPCSDVAASVTHYCDVLGFRINYQQDDLGVMYRDAVTLLLVPRSDAVSFGSAEFYVRDADAL
ncbi:MAG TPA: VOC family protein, partial [Longimicrobiales bacterium]